MKNFILVAALFMASFGANAQTQINAEDAKQHIGEVVSLCGKIFSGRYLQNANNQPTLLNLGGEYPKQLVTVAIFESDRKNFPFKPEEYYPNMDVCVTGKLIEYRGMPEIIVQSVEQIKLQLDSKPELASEPLNKRPDNKKPAQPVSDKKTVPAPATSTENQFDITLTLNVHLRSGPSMEAEPITVLPAGSVVTFLSSGNGWSYVKVKKQIGTSALPDNGFIKNNVLK